MEIRDNLRMGPYNLTMQSHDILKLFGLSPSGPIPPDYEAMRVIGNIIVNIVPRGRLKIKRRVVATCPQCFRQVCAGHLDQHLKVHKVKK